MEPAHSPAPVVASPRAGLTPEIRAFLEQPWVATVATLDADGTPRQAVVWFRLDPDDTILLNSLAGRRWPSNLLRDGRAAIAVTNPDDPFSWVGINGSVRAVVDNVEVARDDIVALAHRYHDNSPEPGLIARFRSQQRVSFHVAIETLHDHLED